MVSTSKYAGTVEAGGAVRVTLGRQFEIAYYDMGVSKNRGGPPKWMVYNGKPY